MRKHSSQAVLNEQKMNELRRHNRIAITFGEKQKKSMSNNPKSSRALRVPAEKLAIEHETSLEA